MKHWKKALPAVMILAALLAGLLLPASGSVPSVNLMAVNDTVVDITVENMPRTVGGVLYVPYTMLSKRDTGINNLGVNSMYSNTLRTVLVSDGQRGVVFDTQANTAQDLEGEPVPARAMVRNTTVFIPIDWLCSYFGTIRCTRTRTPHGTLIRVTSSAAILSDRDFVDAADNQLSANLQRYLESGGRGEGDDPSPSGGVEASQPPSGAELFLALRAGASAQDCAQLLESQGQRGLFLFAPEELSGQGDLVRRVAGAGHTVGLVLTGDELEHCLAAAARGRELLAAAARYNALVVSAPGLDDAGRKALEREGYVLWSATAHGSDFPSGSALVRGLNTRRVNFVEIECGTAGAAFLRGALAAMEEENCQIYQATAPALA